VVEIGNDWVKIAESSFSASGQQAISNINFMKLADIEGPVAIAILKVFKNAKLNKDSVISYIPRHLATVRILELPSTDPKEIGEIIKNGEQEYVKLQERIRKENAVKLKKAG